MEGCSIGRGPESGGRKRTGDKSCLTLGDQSVGGRSASSSYGGSTYREERGRGASENLSAKGEDSLRRRRETSKRFSYNPTKRRRRKIREIEV